MLQAAFWGGRNRVAVASANLFSMIGKMFRTTKDLIGIAALLTAAFCAGCGVASTSPEGGSKRQADTGVSSSGYPAGEPKDAGSPALASSSEAKYSRDQEPEGGKEAEKK